jgi:hypothetical protein
MQLLSKDFLPSLLRRRATEWEKRSSTHADLDLKDWRQISSILKDYSRVEFPFFTKVDAWRAYGASDVNELWVLERLGWGEWKGEHQLLYSMEGIEVPSVEESEIVTISSITPPYLQIATELAWDQEIEGGSVQVAPLELLPEAIRLKVGLHTPKFLRELALTLDQMEEHQIEFAEYIRARIQEFTARLDPSQRKKIDQIDRYFWQERRIELFHDFLEQYLRR